MFTACQCSANVPTRHYFKHYDGRHPISYGVQLPMGRAPFAFAVANSEDLTSYLLRDSTGPFMTGQAASSSLQELWGFEEDSINEQDESILKADWYASSFWGAESVRVFVPRTDDFLLAHAAPLRIQAFLDAFRQASSACWERLVEALSVLEKEASEDSELHESVSVFRRCLLDKVQFAGVEAQIWQGGDLTMDSHTDGATALLHLGVTLGGARTLRVSHFRERHSQYRPQESRRRGRRSGDEISVWNPQAYDREELWDIEQTKGCFYLTSPFCFEHGVKYEKHESSPTFALQPHGRVNRTLRNKSILLSVQLLRDNAGPVPGVVLFLQTSLRQSS